MCKDLTFNLTKLECKSFYDTHCFLLFQVAFNLTKLECKSVRVIRSLCENVLLISPSWNVNWGGVGSGAGVHALLISPSWNVNYLKITTANFAI